MTGNAQVDHRKYVKLFMLTTAGGQFECLQGVIDFWCTLESTHYLIKAIKTSTHDLLFRAKIRKNVYHCKPRFYYLIVGCKGVYIVRTC